MGHSVLQVWSTDGPFTRVTGTLEAAASTEWLSLTGQCQKRHFAERRDKKEWLRTKKNYFTIPIIHSTARAEADSRQAWISDLAEAWPRGPAPPLTCHPKRGSREQLQCNRRPKNGSILGALGLSLFTQDDDSYKEVRCSRAKVTRLNQEEEF